MSTTDRVTAVLDKATRADNTALVAVITRGRALSDDDAAALHRHLQASSDAGPRRSAKGHRLCRARPVPGHGRKGSHRPDRRCRRRRMVCSRRSLRRGRKRGQLCRKMVSPGRIRNRSTLDGSLGEYMAGSLRRRPRSGRIRPPCRRCSRTTSLRDTHQTMAGRN